MNKIPKLHVILKKSSTGLIGAFVRQEASDGMHEGSNILKGKRPQSFHIARTLVHKALGSYVTEFEFSEESQDWERTE